ncbi:MAG: hypothetical protein EXX96DRAFT_477260 [Benjaminiella poitrasii]|nr:MAG: hypothetical protein EXX96DRAFT_477260 [Benjaminiella poitrasii]
MNNFDFSKQRLDVAFRTLCSKLYLKAESQQLDRIIEAFSRRYFECNPDTLLRCFDVVYAVAYSLLLLNTDLHVVGDWATKMSKSSFVKNTMETVQSLVFADETESTTTAQQPRKRCLSTVSRKSADFIVRPLKRNDSLPLAMTFLLNEEDSQLGNYQTVRSETHINVMQPVDTLKSNASWKSSINNINESLIRSQKTWLSDIEGLLKEIYTAVKANGIDQAVITLSLDSQRDSNDENYTLQRSKTLPKNICNPEETKDSLLRRKRGHSFIQIFEANERQQSVANIFSTKQRLSSLPTNIKNEELYKQGIVMRKHMMESTDKRAKHRHWQLCFLVITDTGLIMYKPIQQEQSALKDHEKNTKRKSTSMLLWNSSNSFFSLQDIIQHYPYWKADKDVTPITALPMNHTYTTAIPPPGWNPQRPHVFRLETNEGGVWLFESTDQFAVQAWVEACNLTAAKISKGPLPGAVSNSNYGWSMNNYSTTEQSTMNISVWYPPAPCMINSALSMVDQCNDIETQIKNLSVELDQHRELKLLVDNKV